MPNFKKGDRFFLNSYGAAKIQESYDFYARMARRSPGRPLTFGELGRITSTGHDDMIVVFDEEPGMAYQFRTSWITRVEN